MTSTGCGWSGSLRHQLLHGGAHHTAVDRRARPKRRRAPRAARSRRPRHPPSCRARSPPATASGRDVRVEARVGSPWRAEQRPRPPSRSSPAPESRRAASRPEPDGLAVAVALVARRPSRSRGRPCGPGSATWRRPAVALVRGDDVELGPGAGEDHVAEPRGVERVERRARAPRARRPRSARSSRPRRSRRRAPPRGSVASVRRIGEHGDAACGRRRRSSWPRAGPRRSSRRRRSPPGRRASSAPGSRARRAGRSRRRSPARSPTTPPPKRQHPVVAPRAGLRELAEHALGLGQRLRRPRRPPPRSIACQRSGSMLAMVRQGARVANAEPALGDPAPRRRSAPPAGRRARRAGPARRGRRSPGTRRRLEAAQASRAPGSAAAARSHRAASRPTRSPPSVRTASATSS